MSQIDDKIVWNEDEENGFNLRDFLDFFWNLRYWIIASTLLSVAIAFMYIKVNNPSFEKSAIVMMVDDKGSGSNELSLLYDITGKAQTNKIDNEIFILRSPALMEKVVDKLGLNTRYFEYRVPLFNSSVNMFRSVLNIKKAEFYKDCPFSIEVNSNSIAPVKSVYLEFVAKEDGKYEITELLLNGDKKKLPDNEFAFGESIPLKSSSITLVLTDSIRLGNESEYAVSWETPYNSALRLASSLEVSVLQEKSRNTDMILLKKQDTHPLRAEDILNTLIDKYNQQARTFKNEGGINTINFIDSRLRVISDELGNIESDMRKYQSSNVLVDLESQSHFTLTSDVKYETELNDTRVQLKVLEMINSYLKETGKSDYRVIPFNVGISDNGLNEIIIQYNTLVADRNRLLFNSSANNPRVININQKLSDGKKSIELTVANLVESNSIKERELESLLRSSKKSIAAIPGQQFDMAQIVRKQQIIEPLYLLLQQKREEAQISVYSTTDNMRVIEKAYGSNLPIKPNKSMTLLVAILIGMTLPPFIMLLRILFKIKVETIKDIENKTNAPIIGIIPIDKINRGVVDEKCNDNFAEAFKSVYSNMQFTQGKVFQVTSSMRGEGKSFISANLAMTISHANKKVLLVGLDLRKPSIRKIFSDIKFDEDKSVISYLRSDNDNVDSFVVKNMAGSNLDV
ncbi:MAG: Wzz/FepE/Etk N-terminal domain-containing protein, partial [Bacteroidales bacterium]